MNPFNPIKLISLLCLSVLKSCFVFLENTLADFVNLTHSDNESPSRVTEKRYLIFLLLLISSNIQPNPNPADTNIKICNNPDIKCRSVLGVIHMNIWTVLYKTDMLCIWAKSTDAGVSVLSET